MNRIIRRTDVILLKISCKQRKKSQTKEKYPYICSGNQKHFRMLYRTLSDEEYGDASARILYEDNHLLVVNKKSGEIVQADMTEDETITDLYKSFMAMRDAKPGSVFLGVPHRLDRPVGGVVVFAKTGKGLARMNELFRNGDVRKTYWAITKNMPPEQEGTLTHYIITRERINKSYAYDTPREGAAKAVLKYKVIANSERYHLLEINLLTGRKHQIRTQLSAIGCPVKGDLKYGAERSNPDGSISLLARRIEFDHPVSKRHIDLTAPLPEDRLWQTLGQIAIENGY